MKELPSQLEEIHESFVEGALQIIVGAGSSMAADLPGWNELNAAMVREFFRLEFSAGDETPFPFEDAELETLSSVFTGRFGRDSVIDLLKARLASDGEDEEREFIEMLYEALYGELNSYDLQPIHRELAAAMKQRADSGESAYLYTLNYDDALECAIADVREERPHVVTSGAVHDNSVVHLHGYLPLGGPEDEPVDLKEGDIILSEKDYFMSAGSTADQKLEELFEDDDRDVLLVGMSLEDPRLRRLLHQRASVTDEPDNRVWVLLSEGSRSVADEPGTRKAHRFADHYVPSYWEAWGVEAITVPDHEFVPACLRAIRLGADAGKWVEEGARFLEQRDVYGELYSNGVQGEKQVYLIQKHDLICRKFEVASDEELILSFYIPCKGCPTKIQPVFSFTENRREHRRPDDWLVYPYDSKLGLSPRSPFVVDRELSEDNGNSNEVDREVHVHKLTKDHAESRQLDVSSWTGCEGASGFALVSGTVLDVREEEWFFRNFSPEDQARWEEGQVYSSLFSIPVYDDETWVPIGVACIASIRKEPFWERLTDDEKLNLEGLMRSIFRNVVDYTPVFGENEEP